MSSPTAFISYSHDSDDHLARVLAFCDMIREDGIDCVIDQYEDSPAEGWPRWMTKHIQRADFVLVVCTENYKTRFELENSGDAGRGVKWEGAIVNQEVYNTGSKNTKFVPLVFDTTDIRFIPSILQSATFYDVTNQGQYDALYSRLTGQSLVPKGKVGSLRKIKKKKRSRHQFSVEETTEVVSDNSGSNEDGGGIATLTEMCGIELSIDVDFDEFTDIEQQRVLDAVRELLGVSRDLRITHKKRGSVLLGLELTYEEAERLLWAAKAGQLEEFGVVDASILAAVRRRSKKKFNLKPLGDRLVVQRDDSEETTVGGIVLPDSARDNPTRGTVLSIGEGRLLKDGTRAEMQVRVGDRVLFTSYSPEEIKIGDDNYLLLREDDILAVIE